MKRCITERKLIRQYLLGALDEERQGRLEERLLADEVFLEKVSQAENEVVYDYLSGALSERENERFENHFLVTPERRQKLKFFKALRHQLEQLPEADNALPRSWKRFLPNLLRSESYTLKLALTGAVIVLIGALLFLPHWSARRVDTESPPLVVTLARSRTRRVGDGEMTRVHIPDGTKVVELQLLLGAGDYQSYRAVLLTDKGAEKFTGDNLEARTEAGNKAVGLRVPAAILTRGDYRIILQGRSPAGELQ